MHGFMRLLAKKKNKQSFKMPSSPARSEECERFRFVASPKLPLSLNDQILTTIQI